MNQLTPEQASYIAGFWDGEGSIGVWRCNRRERRTSGTFRVGMMAGNTNLEVLESIRADIGAGTISEKASKNPKHKTLYSLVISQGIAYKLLPMLLPYLRIKKHQALIAINMQKLRRNVGRAGITDEELKVQEQFHTDCAELNKRGKELVM